MNKRGPDQSLIQITLSKSTDRECTPMQALKQSVTLERFDHLDALALFPLSDKLWLIIYLLLFLFCCKPSNSEFYVIYVYIHTYIYIHIYIYIYI